MLQCCEPVRRWGQHITQPGDLLECPFHNTRAWLASSAAQQVVIMKKMTKQQACEHLELAIPDWDEVVAEDWAEVIKKQFKKMALKW